MHNSECSYTYMEAADSEPLEHEPGGDAKAHSSYTNEPNTVRNNGGVYNLLLALRGDLYWSGNT